MKNESDYYLGLDIGTDSVGYAVASPSYTLKKFKGEPMWGTTLFDAATGSADRRAFRTARRRLDRRQQRVQFLEELFAPEIREIDPNFFIRRKESALFAEDSSYGVKIFEGGKLSDAEYHKKYPTIHHLIKDLMESDNEHDIRLVYIACAWLVANRGHFLYDIPANSIDELLSFKRVYEDFQSFLSDQGFSLPWSTDITPDQILMILQKECGVKQKTLLFNAELFGGRKLSKEVNESFPFSTDAVVSLLAGGKVKLKDLFCNKAYSELDPVSLVMNDEDFGRIVSELGDDGELLNRLRALVNCAQLICAMKGTKCISAGKIAVYEQHRKDLRFLKRFVKRYCPEKYNEIFRDAVQDNYLCYSHNTKLQSKNHPFQLKFIGKDAFCDFLSKRLKTILVTEKDKPAYEDMMLRLEARTFLPKQKDGDNRVIPQQLYRFELAAIIEHAQNYTPFLKETDESGLSVAEKILSIFDFRIPYYVGPMKTDGKNAWMVRKAAGKITPWNYADMVDFDRSEQAFIDRMTNRCTYLPGERVLPEHSLLYEKFKVLNELNNLKVKDHKLPPEVKQELYTELYEKVAQVNSKKIRDYLLQHGYMEKQDEISGFDQTVKSNLKSFHIFKWLLDSGKLSESDVEDIIEHMAYCEDKGRMRRWLKVKYPIISNEDNTHLLRQNLKGFGRLSRRFLTDIYGMETGSNSEANTILDLLWKTNENLMQLLSERYTFSDIIRDLSCIFYDEHQMPLNEKLSEMGISNAVKRPIFRTLDVVQDVVKAMGCAPVRIFVEMARGGTPEQKGKRTQSRKEQLLALYKKIKTEDYRQLTEDLEAMGVMADNRLQDRRLFLYYLQMGKCAYSGKPIELSRLSDGTYNLDHIYPQCFVKDDSLHNNLVLVDSTLNDRKKDIYPISADIRKKMTPFWTKLKDNGLMTDEKYLRLTRGTPFSDDEKLGFINRQLVETRQSTKAITTLLQERFPDSEIVYVKSGMVSEFRQEFGMFKCRIVNDLHHAKDAYLNIVVGNVYHERFTKRWFSVNSRYNVQVKEIFKNRQSHGDNCYWRGCEDLALVRKIMEKNAVHLTKYAFCRKGGLFDQQPVKKKAGLIPLKADLPTEKYGGYNKPTASFFVLARYSIKNGHEVMFVPINLMDAARFQQDPAYAKHCTSKMITDITGKQPQDMELLLNERPLKINTVISADGARMTLSGKSSGGRQIILSPLTAIVLGKTMEDYIKTMEAYLNKRKINPAIRPDELHDGLSPEKNLMLYDALVVKLCGWPFSKIPGNQGKMLALGKSRDKFASDDIVNQMNCLIGLIRLMSGKANTCDLTAAGGSKSAGSVLLSSSLSNWAKTYSDVRIVDSSAAGLFINTSGNLLELL